MEITQLPLEIIKEIVLSANNDGDFYAIYLAMSCTSKKIVAAIHNTSLWQTAVKKFSCLQFDGVDRKDFFKGLLCRTNDGMQLTVESNYQRLKIGETLKLTSVIKNTSEQPQQANMGSYGNRLWHGKAFALRYVVNDPDFAQTHPRLLYLPEGCDAEWFPILQPDQTLKYELDVQLVQYVYSIIHYYARHIPTKDCSVNLEETLNFIMADAAQRKLIKNGTSLYLKLGQEYYLPLDRALASQGQVLSVFLQARCGFDPDYKMHSNLVRISIDLRD